MKKRVSFLSAAIVLAGCADVLGIKDAAFDGGTTPDNVVDASPGRDALPADGGADATVLDSPASDSPDADAGGEAEAAATCADKPDDCDGG
jgi:hypothetical protein